LIRKQEIDVFFSSFETNIP
jgi:hypothetical protein